MLTFYAHLCSDIPSGLLSFRFSHQNFICISVLSYVPHATILSSFFIWSHEIYLTNSEKYEAPIYAIFSVPSNTLPVSTFLNATF